MTLLLGWQSSMTQFRSCSVWRRTCVGAGAVNGQERTATAARWERATAMARESDFRVRWSAARARRWLRGTGACVMSEEKGEHPAERQSATSI
jgi:hypothetical protein